MKIAIVSGYFNPLHIGHLDYLEAAKKISDKLIVIVNNDYQVNLKGSIPFMQQADRVRIISALECVDGVTLSTDKDESVLETLKHILVYNQANGRNHFMFCNGGDRSSTNTPEERLCSSNAYQLTSIYNVGGEKRESSSEIISKAAKKDGVSEI
jgi:D-beta-D-heptose 7-phosphate kinase/D-beta-D-heptose 1-phosphate adenosyltransferase